MSGVAEESATRRSHSPALGSPPPAKRPKSATTSRPSSPPLGSTPSHTPHLKRGEELLSPEEQARLIQRRFKDAERKRRKREQMLAARAAAEAAGSEAPLDNTISQSEVPSADTPAAAEIGSPSSQPTQGSAPASAPTSKAKGAEIPAAASAPSSSSKGKASAGEKKAAAEKAASRRQMAEKAALAIETTAEEEKSAGEDEEGEEDEKLYCICKTMYDEERMMIACDRCDEWYHTLCMKMNDEQAQLVDLFICPRCEQHTSDRTTYKPPCLRSSCPRAARCPLSRYCSDRCGLLVAAARVAKTKYAKQSSGGPDRLYSTQVRSAVKKEGMARWDQDVQVMQAWLHQVELRECPIEGKQEAKLDSDSHQHTRHSLPQAEALHDLRASLQNLTENRQSVSTLLDLAENRLKLLQLVDDRLGLLPPISVEETAQSSKKSKAKGKGAKAADGSASSTLKTQPRCGYDERLSWDDERFSSWMASTTGRQILDGVQDLDGRLTESETQAVAEEDFLPTVCGVARRKCRRHADWSLLRSEEFEKVKAAQTSTLSSLSEQMAHAQARISELEDLLRKQRIAEDERLAHSIAQEVGGIRVRNGIATSTVTVYT
ncbi:unnamed protein product [Parajaminaea phylloscopi]